MKEVALADSDPALAALIDEVAAKGEPVLLTRNGRPAATLSPTPPQPAAAKTALGALLLAHLDRVAAENPQSTAPLTWEDVKADMYPEDRAL